VSLKNMPPEQQMTTLSVDFTVSTPGPLSRADREALTEIVREWIRIGSLQSGLRSKYAPRCCPTCGKASSPWRPALTGSFCGTPTCGKAK